VDSLAVTKIEDPDKTVPIYLTKEHWYATKLAIHHTIFCGQGTPEVRDKLMEAQEAIKEVLGEK
jgi:hypothetical protein